MARRAKLGIVKPHTGGNSGKAVSMKKVPGPVKTKRAAVKPQKPVGVDPANPGYGINTQNLGVNVGSPGRPAGAVTQRVPASNYPKAKRQILGGLG